MEDYRRILQEEEIYLEHTNAVLKEQLKEEEKSLAARRKSMESTRREMWENAGFFPDDFTAAAEISQYRDQVILQTETYLGNLARVERYKRMTDSPYFGRFDFIEEGEEEPEKIYVGLGTLTDPNSHKVLVYDWRAPICSVFYRHELGPADFETPAGTQKGEVVLKRQYKIKKGKLVHFFDSSIVIRDEMLQDILSRNASPEMKSIVESIQKEQDIVIRDEKLGLVIVQGAAGSGKTSIALHRIAFLLYEGLSSNLNSRNIIILSPNELFSRYIAGVLPDLGEENVDRITFDTLSAKALEEPDLKFETRTEQMERIIENQDSAAIASIDFKGSTDFVLILERFLKYYEQKLHPFEDVYYNGVMVANRQQLKNRFLLRRRLPMARRLEHIETGIWESVDSLRKERLKKIEQVVQRIEGHDLEIKPFSRLLSLKETRALGERIRKFTKISYWSLYRKLLNPDLFFRFTRDLTLPGEIREIIEATSARLDQGIVYYEDAAALFYLKLRTEGSEEFPWIRHVVIDEAQDYSLLQYHIFKMLFKGAGFTILGDVSQSMERSASMSLYDEVIGVFQNKEAVKVVLSKTYRSSYEISAFTQRLLGQEKPPGVFERHDEPPRVEYLETEKLMEEAVARDARDLLNQGFQSIAVICKTKGGAEKLYGMLRRRLPVTVIGPDTRKLEKGIVVVPVYLAKGLEFDAVLICGAGKEEYSSELDKRLLYIACTRALHRLVIYITGEKSPFLLLADVNGF